jgi:hypothetical protein
MSVPTNLHRDLGRIEGKLDAVLADMRSQLGDHETRIRVLEDDKDQRAGAVKAARWLWGSLTAAFGIVAGAFGSGYLVR